MKKIRRFLHYLKAVYIIPFCVLLLVFISTYIPITKTLLRVDKLNQIQYNSEISKFTFENLSSRHLQLNSSCIVVGCFSHGTVGVDFFWNYYSKKGYTLTLFSFSSIKVGNRHVHPTWCRIPAVMKEKARNPEARVLYIDIDTLADVDLWCNMPYLGEHTPIVMTSLFRLKPEPARKFTVHGTQVQANLFIVAPGRYGMNAMNRWDSSFGFHEMREQGSVHIEEGRNFCGVPGWIQCYRNPEQQKCHCSTQFKGNLTAKRSCIEKLFQGRRRGCIVSVD